MERKNNYEKEISTDDLAQMIAKGFDGMDKRFSGIENRLSGLETDIKAIKDDTENIKAELNKKVDKFEHNTLEYRVEKLEKKLA